VRLDPQKWGPADVACARPTQTTAFPWRRRASHIRFLVQPLSIQDDTYHHHDRDTKWLSHSATVLSHRLLSSSVTENNFPGGHEALTNPEAFSDGTFLTL
jgi:hypothetical protein